MVTGMKELRGQMKRKAFIFFSTMLLLACSVGVCGCSRVASSQLPESSDETTVTSSETTETTAEETGASKFSPEGLWRHTNCHSGIPSTLEIKNADEEGFDFHLDIFYFANSDMVEGRALFTSDSKAVFPKGEDDPIAEPAGSICFEFDGDTVKVTGEGRYASGAGAIVHLSGDYTLGEPVYANANIVEETFSETELNDLRSILTEEEYDLFIEDTKEGAIIVDNITLDDGSSARRVTSLFPGIAGSKGYSLIITDDGRTYYKNCAGEFVTNDKSYSGDEMPESI